MRGCQIEKVAVSQDPGLTVADTGPAQAIRADVNDHGRSFALRFDAEIDCLQFGLPVGGAMDRRVASRNLANDSIGRQMPFATATGAVSDDDHGALLSSDDFGPILASLPAGHHDHRGFEEAHAESQLTHQPNAPGAALKQGAV